jgi:hypothetical protein
MESATRAEHQPGRVYEYPAIRFARGAGTLVSHTVPMESPAAGVHAVAAGPRLVGREPTWEDDVMPNVVGQLIRLARSPQGRKVIAQARQAAQSPQGRKVIAKAQQAARDPKNRERLQRMRTRKTR